MSSIRAVPHGLTGETRNFLMFGRDLDLPETLISGPIKEGDTREQYTLNTTKQMETAY